MCLFSLNVKKPSTEELTAYYAKAVMTKPMKWFCRQSAKNKFSEYAKRTMEETASKKMPTATLIRGKWIITNMPAVADEARFTKCGICTLMKELGL